MNLRLTRKRAGKRGQIKDVNVTGITVTPIGTGAYYGFELDGDKLYMLEDFTVCHNSSVSAEIGYNFAEKCGGVGGIFLEEGMQSFTCYMPCMFILNY